jgi:hypothetical protein
LALRTCAIEEALLIGVIDRLQGHRGGGLVEIIGSTIVGIVPVLDGRGEVSLVPSAW